MCGEDGARPDGDVVGDTHLPRQHRPVADRARARNADLRHQDDVFSYIAVMADLNQVVDLAAPPDDGLAESRTVDGAIGADLDVLLDAQPSYLGNLAVRRAVERVAEAIGTEHRARMDDDPVADDDAVLDDHARMEHHVVAERRSDPHEAERPHPAPRPDARVSFDDGAGAHQSRRVHARPVGDHGRRMDARRYRGLGVEEAQKQLDGNKVELDKLRDELEKKGQLLSADARRDKQDQLERKLRDAQRLAGDLEKELQRKEQNMGAKILRELEGIFTRVGKEKGYVLIIERRQAGIVYGAPDADVTEEVIKAFDDEMRKAKK